MVTGRWFSSHPSLLYHALQKILRLRVWWTIHACWRCNQTCRGWCSSCHHTSYRPLVFQSVPSLHLQTPNPYPSNHIRVLQLTNCNILSLTSQFFLSVHVIFSTSLLLRVRLSNLPNFHPLLPASRFSLFINSSALGPSHLPNFYCNSPIAFSSSLLLPSLHSTTTQKIYIYIGYRHTLHTKYN